MPVAVAFPDYFVIRKLCGLCGIWTRRVVKETVFFWLINVLRNGLVISYEHGYVFGGGMETSSPLPHGGNSRPCEAVLA